MNNKQYPTRMHEVLGVETGERFKIEKLPDEFFLNHEGRMIVVIAGRMFNSSGDILTYAINNGIIRKPRPGCWHCWNIEAHKIEYVTAVKDKDGRPMNTPTDIPYRYCPSCGRKLGVEG